MKVEKCFVHVMAERGEPELEDERACGEPDNGQTVIFHESSYQDGVVWKCQSCGHSAADPDAA